MASHLLGLPVQAIFSHLHLFLARIAPNLFPTQRAVLLLFLCKTRFGGVVRLQNAVCKTTRFPVAEKLPAVRKARQISDLNDFVKRPEGGLAGDQAMWHHGC
jgi:hypothetical protein